MTTVAAPRDPYIGIDEAAKFCGVCSRTMKDFYQKGLVPFYKVGRRILFRASDLDAYMQRFRVDPAAVELVQVAANWGKK